MNIGENIRKLRVAKDLTQRELAEALGYTTQNISKWENGISMPDLPTVLTLARYFQVSTDVLLGHVPKDQRLELTEISINAPGRLSLWTDFDHEGTVAPAARVHAGRRRTGCPEPRLFATHPDGFVLAVDREGRICNIFVMLPHWVTPYIFKCYSERAYFRPGTEQACILPVPGAEGDWLKAGQYECLVPEGGMLLEASCKDALVEGVLRFIVPREFHVYFDNINSNYIDFRNTRDGRSLFGCCIKQGGLDDIRVALEGERLVFSKPGQFVDPLEVDIANLTQLVKAEMARSLKDLQDRMTEIQDEVESLRDDVDDLEGQVGDLDGRVCELEQADYEESEDE